MLANAARLALDESDELHQQIDSANVVTGGCIDAAQAAVGLLAGKHREWQLLGIRKHAASELLGQLGKVVVGDGRAGERGKRASECGVIELGGVADYEDERQIGFGDALCLLAKLVEQVLGRLHSRLQERDGNRVRI